MGREYTGRAKLHDCQRAPDGRWQCPIEEDPGSGSSAVYWLTLEDDGCWSGARYEFFEDGKLKLDIGKENGGLVFDATYTVDGDSFTMKRNAEGKESTYKITIKKITENELETANPEGKTTSFKKVK